MRKKSSVDMHFLGFPIKAYHVPPQYFSPKSDLVMCTKKSTNFLCASHQKYQVKLNFACTFGKQSRQLPVEKVARMTISSLLLIPFYTCR